MQRGRKIETGELTPGDSALLRGSKPRQWAVLEVSSGEMSRLILGQSKGYPTLPDDLAVLFAWQSQADRLAGVIRLLVESEAFSPVPAAKLPPVLSPDPMTWGVKMDLSE